MIRRLVVMVCLLLLLPSTLLAAKQQPWQWIKPHRLMELLKEGSALWVIDLRSPVAFEQGHIEGAVHIPAELIKVKTLPPNKMLVLVDDRPGVSDARGAAELLQKRGLAKLFILEGGMPLWEQERLPVAGTAQGKIFRQLLPQELAKAGDVRKSIRVYDLREKSEQASAPLKGAEAIAGATLEQRLKSVRERLLTESRKLTAARLDPYRMLVLVFPMRSEPLKELERRFNDLPGDIRYMDGGRVEAEARKAAGVKSRVGDCATCPGGKK